MVENGGLVAKSMIFPTLKVNNDYAIKIYRFLLEINQEFLFLFFLQCFTFDAYKFQIEHILICVEGKPLHTTV